MSCCLCLCLLPGYKVKNKDEITTACEQSGDHPETVEESAQARGKVAAAKRVAHLTPVAAQAQLMSEGMGGEDLPSMKALHKARRAHVGGSSSKGSNQRMTGEDWLKRIQAEIATEKLDRDCVWHPLVRTAGWLPLAALHKEPPPCAEGSVLLMSRNQQKLAEKLLADGHNNSKKVNVLIDTTWKIVVEGSFPQQS